MEFPDGIRPTHQRCERLRQFRSGKLYLTQVNHAVVSVERNPISLVNCFPVGMGGLCPIVTVELLASHDAALAPAPRDNRRVARLTPRGREDSLGDEHPA